MHKEALTALGLFLLLALLIPLASFAESHTDLLGLHVEKESIAERALQSEMESPPEIGAVHVPIFIYHSVRPHIDGENPEQDAYDVTPELLEQQLQYLKENNYTTISLDDLHDYLVNGVTPALKPVILTFDDGWHNQYVNAFPLLKKYGMTGTFYVYTNVVGKNHFLTWDEIQEMDHAGMTIGSHTKTHPYLSSLSDSQLREEIIDSKKILEDKLGKPVNHFASPFGYTSDKVVSIIKEAGYSTARTTYRGTYHTTKDLFTLRGILVSDALQDFIRALNE
jgi:peptidoglycan/xylan/chitin deacetylase (PgdA/CDA1 family)